MLQNCRETEISKEDLGKAFDKKSEINKKKKENQTAKEQSNKGCETYSC